MPPSVYTSYILYSNIIVTYGLEHYISCRIEPCVMRCQRMCVSRPTYIYVSLRVYVRMHSQMAINAPEVDRNLEEQVSDARFIRKCDSDAIFAGARVEILQLAEPFRVRAEVASCL